MIRSDEIEQIPEGEYRVGDIMYTEIIDCPLCGCKDNSPVFEEITKIFDRNFTLGINECATCQLCYVSPRLNDSGLSQLYNNEYLEQTVSGIYNVSENVSELEYVQFYKYLNKELPNSGSVLDVGCGVGLMLDKIAQYCPQLESKGIEFSEYAGKKAIEKGHKVYVGDIIQMKELQLESFDAIIILYVLEHVPDPIAVLQKCHSLLKNGGKLLLAVPNYRYLKISHTGILSRMFFGKPSNLFSNEHLFNYTPKTIKKVINKGGFDISFIGQSKPLKAGTIAQRIFKLLFASIFYVLFKCGFQFGGIHVIASKSNARGK